MKMDKRVSDLGGFVPDSPTRALPLDPAGAQLPNPLAMVRPFWEILDAPMTCTVIPHKTWETANDIGDDNIEDASSVEN